MDWSKEARRPAAFIVAGAASGTGKTTVALGIMAALKGRGLVVQPFKAGPDYIDPSLHRALVQRPSYNLDTWMMGPEAVRRIFTSRIEGAHAAIVEGVMGLYDGKDGTSDEGSTAHLAKVLKLPVLLVVNAEKTARSAGAVVLGFERYDPSVRIKWVVFNRVAGQRHFDILKDSLHPHSKAKVIGYIPRDQELTLPERHLGLAMHGALDRQEWKGFVGRAAHHVEEHVDLDAVLGEAPKVWSDSGLALPESPKAAGETASVEKARLAVALDDAFSFYYEENLEMLRSLGVETVFFSPLKDRELPEGAAGVYIGGGYPELYAKELEANPAMRKAVKDAAESGMPVFAECGGLMYLGRAMKDAQGKTRAMAGVFPWTSRMLKKRRSLGYREITALDGCPFLAKGEVIRGHEFHYSELAKEPAGVKKAFSVTSSGGETADEGYVLKNTLASYVHVHFASNPAFAEGFARALRPQAALPVEEKKASRPRKRRHRRRRRKIVKEE